MHGILCERDKTIMSSGLLYEASGGAAVGGMPGCLAKPTDLASRGTLIWVPFAMGSKDRGYDNFIPAVYIVQV